MIRLIVDSSSDFVRNELTAPSELVPIGITLGEQSFLDGIDLDKNDFYELMAEGDVFPKTAMPSPAVFAEMFEAAKAQGDEVICILLSSALSGTYQSAVTAKEMVGYDKVYIIDSLRASACIKIMFEYAKRLIDEGATAGEIAKKLEEFKLKTKVLASLDTLEYLYRGGRLSRAGAVIGAVTNIKPIVTISNDGNVTVLKKSLGFSRAKSDLLELIKKQNIDTDFPVYSLYTCGTVNCEKLENELAEASIIPDSRVQVGPTIGAHIGPEAFGLFFVER